MSLFLTFLTVRASFNHALSLASVFSVAGAALLERHSNTPASRFCSCMHTYWSCTIYGPIQEVAAQRLSSEIHLLEAYSPQVVTFADNHTQWIQRSIEGSHILMVISRTGLRSSNHLYRRSGDTRRLQYLLSGTAAYLLLRRDRCFYHRKPR